MASTKFGTYYLDNDCSNMHRDNYNMNSENFETESFKLLFIIITSFFVYNFSTKLFENNKNVIKPLECSYKFLFNYVNNQDLSEQIDENEVEDELEVDEDEVSEEEEEEVEVEVEVEEEDDDEDDDEVDDDEVEEDDDDEVDDDEVDDEEVSDSEIEENEEDKYNELFKEHEFKVVLLNFLKNKDSSNDEKFEKYKSLIENLEKDIQEYVYV